MSSQRNRRIVALVREVHVCRSWGSGDPLPLFANPEGQFRTVKVGRPVPVRTLLELLRRHQKLQTLSFALRPAGPNRDLLPQVEPIMEDAMALETLSQVKDLQVVLEGYSRSWFQGYGLLIGKVQKVKKLGISCPDYIWTADATTEGLVGSSPMYPPARLDHVTKLALDRLPLSGPQQPLLQCIDFSRSGDYRLWNVTESQPF